MTDAKDIPFKVVKCRIKNKKHPYCGYSGVILDHQPKVIQNMLPKESSWVGLEKGGQFILYSIDLEVEPFAVLTQLDAMEINANGS